MIVSTSLRSIARIVALSCISAPAVLGAEKPAEKPATEPAAAALIVWKTPDGPATLITNDDPSLATGPITSGLPPVVCADPALVHDLVDLMDQSLTLIAKKTSDKDPSYYEDGVWHFSSEMIACQGGPAHMAAELWSWRRAHPQAMDDAAKARQPWLRQFAVDTFEHLIRDGQAPDGEIKNPGSHAWFVMSDFVDTYLLLKDTLDEPTRARWLAAMKREVEWFRIHGDIPNPDLTGWLATTWRASDGWYINGNVNLYQAATLYSLYLATGEAQYKHLFELEWRHTLSPTAKRWKGCGLFYLKTPTKLDASDGVAFVTEKGEGDPGFDIAYTTVQLTVLCRLYVRSHDLRVLRVINLELNAETPHLDLSTLILNGTYGSRHHDVGPFCNISPAVLAWTGGREDWLPRLRELFDKAIKPEFLKYAPTKLNNPGMYRGYGDLATMLEAASGQ